MNLYEIFLVESLASRLLKIYGPKIVSLDPQSLIEDLQVKLEEHDLKESTYLGWLVKQYANGELSTRNLEKVMTQLEKFDKYKPGLQNKDINQYTLASLQKVTDVPSGKEQKAEIGKTLLKNKEYSVVYDKNGYKVYWPHTEAASCYLGQGTRWCTAATMGNNYFDEYSDVKGKSRLYYVVTPNKEKFAIFVGGWVSLEIFTAADLELLDNLRFFKKHAELLNVPYLQLAMANYNGSVIQYIKNPSEAVQLAAVEDYGNNIQYIKNPSEKVQLVAVDDYPPAVQYIKNPSEKVQLAAVKGYPPAIQYIKNPSEKVQLVAVHSNIGIIQYIKNPTPKVIEFARKRHG